LRYTAAFDCGLGEAVGRGVLAGWRVGVALVVGLGFAAGVGFDVRLAVAAGRLVLAAWERLTTAAG
jgi:hypothetical protein